MTIHMVAVLLFLVLGKVQSQLLRAEVALGSSMYSGDLNSGIPNIKDVRAAMSIGLTYDVADKFRFRARYTAAKVTGDDRFSSRADFQKRGLNFFSNISEISLLGEYDFCNQEQYSLIPYIFGGLGYYSFNPKTNDKNGNIVELANIGTEGQFLTGNPKGKGQTYNLNQMNLQAGAGIRYQLTEDIDLGAEFCFRYLFTDYLDDVHSSFYVKASEFNMSDPAQKLAYELSFRGTRDESKFNYTLPRGLSNNDAYSTFQLSARFRLNFASSSHYGSYKVRFF